MGGQDPHFVWHLEPAKRLDGVLIVSQSEREPMTTATSGASDTS